YTNLADGAWWVSLLMEALGERLRYLAIVQKVGHGETGVLALTVYAELARPESDETATAVEPEPALELSPTDSVTLAYTDRFADRHEEAEELLRRTLRSAVERFVGRLGCQRRPSHAVARGFDRLLPGRSWPRREHDHLDVVETARRIVGVARRVWLLSTSAKRSVPWRSHAGRPRVRGAPAAG